MLSLSRIVFLFIIGGLLLVHVKGAVSLALVLFIIAAVTDWADGYVARRFNMITDFGKLMDALADKILMVGMFVCLLSVHGLLPAWSVFLVLIIIAREFLITGLRLVAASKGVVLAAEQGGKIKTVFQIIAVSLLLLSQALKVDFALNSMVQTCVFGAGMILFVIATYLTVSSGYTYLMKYAYLFKESSNNDN